jgi:hypothetical protein
LKALSAAGLTVAVAFRLLPKGLRFRAAVALARWLEPVVQRTGVYQERSRLNTDRLAEISLDLVLMMLTRHGTTFDPILHVNGLEHVREPGSGATLIVGAHAMLGLLLVRYLDDRGHAPIVIAADRLLRYSGTRKAVPVLFPTSGLFFELRRIFEGGRTVFAAIDRGEAHPRNSKFETARGPLLLSSALLKFAVKRNVRILFISSRLDERSRVVIGLAAPSPESRSVRAVLADFAGFVDNTHRVPVTRSSPGPTADPAKAKREQHSAQRSHVDE